MAVNLVLTHMAVTTTFEVIQEPVVVPNVVDICAVVSDAVGTLPPTAPNHCKKWPTMFSRKHILTSTAGRSATTEITDAVFTVSILIDHLVVVVVG